MKMPKMARQKARHYRRFFRPTLEPLEDRILLAWEPLGPAPQSNGWWTVADAPTEPVTGRASALAFGQDNAGQAALFLGAEGGGVFRSIVDAAFTANTPTWSARTEFDVVDPQTGVGAGYANINSITVDPGNPKVIYAGTGHPYGSDMHGSGILVSFDGGNTFAATVTDQGPTRADGLPAFFQRDITQIIVDPRSYDAALGFSTTLYASVTGPAGTQESGVWKWERGDVDWVQVAGTNAPGKIGDGRFGARIDERRKLHGGSDRHSESTRSVFGFVLPSEGATGENSDSDEVLVFRPIPA